MEKLRIIYSTKLQQNISNIDDIFNNMSVTQNKLKLYQQTIKITNYVLSEEINELKQFTENKGMEMLKDLQKQGKIKEANELLSELNKIQEAIKQLEKISRINFNKPKPVSL